MPLLQNRPLIIYDGEDKLSYQELELTPPVEILPTSESNEAADGSNFK